jgi:sulfoacetaldehyde dehydrogenase
VSYRHYLNITRIVRTIPPRVPTLDQIFGEFHRKHGK